MPLKHMKKIFVTLLLVVMTISASAQIVVSHNSNVARLDMDGDGVWDTEVNIQGIPGISFMRCGRSFYSELGRIYVINQWRQYERMGQNPAAYLPNPGGNGDFSAYAGYYARYIGGGGMMAPMGGMVGMPGQASISVGGKNFGFSVSVPVRNRSNVGTMYTPNASVGVNINGNYVGASVPVSVVTGKNANRTVRTVAQPRTVQPQTRSQQPVQVVREMSVEEVQQMLNSGDYM